MKQRASTASGLSLTALAATKLPYEWLTNTARSMPC